MNPFIAFAFVWILVVALHALRVLYFYDNFSVTVTSAILAGFAISLAVVKFSPSFWHRRKLSSEEIAGQITNISRFRIVIFGLAVLILLFELITFKGFPLLWLFDGDPRTYVDFGIPTLHGIFNALWLFVSVVSGGMLVIGYNKRQNGIYFVICIVVIILLYSRAMLFIVAIQLASVVLVRVRRSFTVPVVSALAAAALVAIFGFGVIGNARVGCGAPAVSGTAPATVPAPTRSREGSLLPYLAKASDASPPSSHFLRAIPVGCNIYVSMVAKDRQQIFSIIPTEFLWFYAYSTSGLNNLIYNIPNVHPSYLPFYTLSKLVPTAVYSALRINKNYDSFELEHPAFTVSTAFYGMVSDFGYLGFVFMVPLLLLSYLVYQGALGGSVVSNMVYATLFQSIILSPFIDTILYGTFVVQIALLVCSAIALPKVRGGVGRTPN